MKTAITFSLLFLSVQLVYAQTPPEKQGQEHAAFDSFHSDLDKLKRRFGSKTTSGGVQLSIAQSLDNITEYMKFLESVIRSGEPIPKEYLASVDLDAKLLKRLAGQESGSEPERKRLYEELKELESDLTLKITAERGSSDVARLVQVFVHAKKGDQEVGTYEVWYVPKGWVSDPSVFKRFDRLTDPSNPASMNLAPGNYFIWLRKGPPVTDRQPVSIGAHGEAKREIEVAVP